MKPKIYHLTVVLFFAFLFSSNLNAQYCGNSGSGICMPGGPYPALGFYPPYDSTPCVEIGVPYTHVVDMQIPAQVFYLGAYRTLNWVKVNSVSNLPCGLCWSTNVTNNTFNGNSTNCIRITGTSYDAPGQYRLAINIDANATVGFPVTLTNQDASAFGVKFWARVENLDGTCIIVDTLATGNTAHTVGAVPAPTITGASSVCSGATTTLGISGGTYYGYKWSTGESTSTITAGAGTYTVTVYANCASATATKTVTSTTVSATATANGPVTFCQGGSVTLNAGSGFSDYNWSNGGGTSQTATYNSTGNYNCTVTQNGCTGTTNTVTVTVNNNPAPTVTTGGPTTFCAGGSVTLDAGAGYSAYAWSNGGGSSQTATYNASGNYDCTVTQNGCTGTSNTVSVTVNSVSPTITANGPVSFCTGGSVTLDAGAGYSAYAWSGGGTGQTKVVTASGNYDCTVTLNGCTGTSNTITVTVSGSSLSPVITASNGLNLCAGGSTTLDAGSGYTSYSWSSGGGSNQSFSASTGATYTVTVSQGACTGTASATVNVGNFPVTVNLTPANPPSGCQGDVINLDAGSGHASYAWSTNESTQDINVNSSDTYTVTATDNNACTGTASVVVTINALPVPSLTPSGTQTICSGSSVTLDAGSGYSSYSWSNGDNSQTSSVSSAGSYYVTVTQNGCEGASTSPIVVAVTQLPSPSISPAGTQTICSGNEITLDAGSGYSAYLWSTGATTQTIAVDSTGTYNVTVTQNNCNGSSSNPPTVFVNVTPNATITELGSAGGFAVLQAGPANATYQWLFQSQSNGSYTLEPTTTDLDTVTCGDVGEYHTVVVTQNGCVDTSDQYTVICVGINNVSSLMSFSVQPNPANDVLNVTYELNQPTRTQVSVIDLTGRKVLDVLNEMQNKGTYQHNIRLDNLAPGIYLLNFTTDRGNFNTKFVKQ